MNPAIADLLKVLQLERLEINLFRGVSRDLLGTPRVFGGQVLGQALFAASATVEADRAVHSLHSYFLLPGDVNAPIIYEVDRSRDGGSFSSRRVVAIQHGQQIFHMSASFQTEQDGLNHQLPMPSVPAPETLPDMSESLSKAAGTPGTNWRNAVPLPIEFRAVDSAAPHSDGSGAPTSEFWFRTTGALPDTPMLHRSVLAYASDFHLLYAAAKPHGITLPNDKVRMATIDHAMWFHRPLRVDDWLLYCVSSPSASGSRGLALGSVFSRSGQLVASVAQEGMVRVKR
jgi:acyl-CoA thioesterase-2